MTTAILRSVPRTFADAITESPPDPAIDVELARRQHALYRSALEDLGCRVVLLPSDDRFPDACFVEDCALVVDGIALVTRPGAPSRRGEIEGVAHALEKLEAISEIFRVDAPATLDGGDCMRVGRHLFVGVSGRTNAAGVERVREVFGARGFTVVPIALEGVLHLKCICSPLGDDRVLLADGTQEREVFEPMTVVTIPRNEAYAANCVTLSNGALVADGFPETQRIVEGAGYRTSSIDVSEMRKADGALTCLSILI